MARYLAVMMSVAITLAACYSPFATGGCASGGYQCAGNTVQYCGSTGSAEPSWQSVETCVSPQVCRVNAAGPDATLGAPIENGCFDPNAYCHGGAVSCTWLFGADPDLWSCLLRASDQTFRWTRTFCGAQVPKAMCFEDPATPAACFEVVEICTANRSECEGNVVLSCSTVPIIIDNKAVFDWDRTDCTLGGRVCRVVSPGGASCVNP
jgi:hypothetical protein